MATHVYQMSINYNVGGQFASNILHFTMDDSGFTTTALAASGLIQGWDSANRTRLRNLLSSHVALLSYRARMINGSGGFEGQLLVGAGVIGNRSGNLMAAGIGPVSVLYPNGNGPQRGRIFWPGISDDDCTDGIIQSTYFGVLNTSLAGIIAPFNATGGGSPTVQPAIWSRKTLTAYPIHDAQTSVAIGQVRRRQLPA